MPFLHLITSTSRSGLYLTFDTGDLRAYTHISLQIPTLAGCATHTAVLSPPQDSLNTPGVFVDTFAFCRCLHYRGLAVLWQAFLLYFRQRL